MLKVRDFSKCLAVEYLLPGETIHFVLHSDKEEFAFTSQAVLAVIGTTATTTRKLVTRYDYKTHKIDDVRFETAGRVDRDVEIKFTTGSTSISIDIAKDEVVTACIYYKVLELLSREQHHNARNWDLAGGFTLTSQSDEALTWLQTLHNKYIHDATGMWL